MYHLCSIPVLDPVYLECITENKMVYFYFISDGRTVRAQVVRLRRNSRHGLIVLSSRILIARPIRGDTTREVGFN